VKQCHLSKPRMATQTILNITLARKPVVFHLFLMRLTLFPIFNLENGLRGQMELFRQDNPQLDHQCKFCQIPRSGRLISIWRNVPPLAKVAPRRLRLYVVAPLHHFKSSFILRQDIPRFRRRESNTGRYRYCGQKSGGQRGGF
jgi:hypothetical protein